MTSFRPKMFSEAENVKTSPKLIIQLLIFILVFGIIYLAEGIGSAILVIPRIVSELLKDGTTTINFQQSYELTSSLMSDWKVMIPTLIVTIFGTILSIVYCRFIERRPLCSMGMRKRKAVPHYLRGILTGLALMSIITGITLITGATDIKVASDINISIILLYFLGFFIQGMSEEFIFRGYLMNSIGGNHSPATAIAVSSIAFACVHLANPGIGVLAFLNLVLFGVFAGLYMICFDDIWGVCAIHSVWNFTQGNIFGISVSGTGNIDTVLATTAVSDKAWLTGGEFGIEGSIFTTIVLIIASAAVIFKIKAQQANKDLAA